MNEDGRFIPPGPGRIAAFSRRGGHPEAYSALLGSGIGLLTAAALLYLLRERAQEGLFSLFRDGLYETRAGWIAPATFGERVLLPTVYFTAPVVLAAVSGFLFATVLPAVAARRGRAMTAVSLPALPKMRLVRFAVRSFGATIAIVAVLLVARESVRAAVADGDPSTAAAGALLRITAVVGAVLTAVGAVERILVRHGIYRALFLNRSEYRRERRAQEGNRGVTAQAARVQAREAER